MTKPCKTCPFLEANRGKPTPTDFKCVEQNQTDWYSQENLDGVWQVMKSQPVAFLSCHSTDPDYYGKSAKTTYACVGATLAVYMHLLLFQKSGGLANYTKLVGTDVAMWPNAILEKAGAIATGRTSPLWDDNMRIAKDLNLDLTEIRFPTGFEPAVNEFKKLLTSKK